MSCLAKSNYGTGTECWLVGGVQWSSLVCARRGAVDVKPYENLIVVLEECMAMRFLWVRRTAERERQA